MARFAALDALSPCMAAILASSTSLSRRARKLAVAFICRLSTPLCLRKLDSSR